MGTTFFDTDSNAATGSIAAAGQPTGAEYKLEIVDDTSNLSRWTGTVFEPASTQTPILTTWLSGFGPALELNRRDLGDAASFRFVFVTSNGADVDLAPDVATWSYALSALQLTAGRLVLSPARAGIKLLAHMEVKRSDFEIPLTDGAITCAAKVGGASLAGRGAFFGDRVGCSWRLPKKAGGKRLAGSVAVTFQGVTAKRAFAVRVK